MGHMAVIREHIALSFGNNTASLSWPSGGHIVCLMTSILVYRLSKIMFASHRGVYMKILNGCYQNHECFPSVDNYINFWFPSWILPIIQCLVYFPTTHYVGHRPTQISYYGRHQNYAFCPFCRK